MEVSVTSLTFHDRTQLTFSYNVDMNNPLILPAVDMELANACLALIEVQALRCTLRMFRIPLEGPAQVFCELQE